MITDRRSLLRSLLLAPAVVAAANLMPVRSIARLASPDDDVINTLVPRDPTIQRLGKEMIEALLAGERTEQSPLFDVHVADRNAIHWDAVHGVGEFIMPLGFTLCRMEFDPVGHGGGYRHLQVTREPGFKLYLPPGGRYFVRDEQRNLFYFER